MDKSAKKATPPEVVSNRCSKIEAKTRQPTWAHPRDAVGLEGAARLAETHSSACAAYGSMAPASRPYAERSSSSPSVMVGPKCRQLGNHHLGHRALCPASVSQNAAGDHVSNPKDFFVGCARAANVQTAAQPSAAMNWRRHISLSRCKSRS